VIADSLDDGNGAAVTDSKSFADSAANKQVASCRAIQNGVTPQRVGSWIVLGVGTLDRDRPTVHPLADVVVGLAGQVDVEPGHQEGAKTLSGGSGELHHDRARGKAFRAETLRDAARK